MIMLVVDGSIFASFGFAYIHVSMRLQVCPPPGASLPPLSWTLASSGLLALGSVLIWLATRALGKRRLPWLALAALVCTCAAFGIDMEGFRQAGLDGSSSAWAAAISAMLGYQGLHIAVLLIVGPYLALRAWRGHLSDHSRATLDNSALIWHYTTLQGIARSTLIRVMPLLME